MNIRKILKSEQEQAVASWMNYLNQVRLERLTSALSKEEINLQDALEIMKSALETIEKDIVNNGKGRGGAKGMHGFIAEVAECGIGNARSRIEGKLPVYEWINDNGPDDLRRGALLIQQKFVQSGNHLSLQAVKMHLEKNPDYLKEGHIYQIPADHYEKIKWLLSIPKHEANRMPTSTGEFSLSQWREVHEFFASGQVPLESIEPSILDYSEVQRNTYGQTFAAEEERLKTRNLERKEHAYRESRPTLREGAKATAVAAAAEGGVQFCMAVVKKCKEGKRIADFSESDWKEIAGESGIGTMKGGVRGVSIYTLTNYTATPAAVANSLVTASFGVAEQAYRFRKGQLDEVTFIENSEILCLEAAVSALSSFLGQAVIPVPVLGAIIGNAVGSVLYQIAEENLSRKEQCVIADYVKSIRETEASLERQYRIYIDRLNENTEVFLRLLDATFLPNAKLALESSVELAKMVGVPADEILDSKKKIRKFFT